VQSPANNAVISISSHVVRGCVGNRASVFALETLGHSVWAIPTVVMPWHPGQGRSTRINPDQDSFCTALAELSQAKWRGEVHAALTGYFADAQQVRAAARLIATFRSLDPDFIYLCDPVIGDSGGLYVPVDVAEAIRDELLPLASIATPNRFELGWLAQMPVEDNNAIVKAAGAVGVPQMVVTSAHAMMTSSIANLLLSNGKAFLAEHRELDTVPNGLGDLLSAVFLSHRLSGLAGEEALQKAVSSVFEIAARSVASGSDELLLAHEAASLKTPMAMVSMRNFLTFAARRRRVINPVIDDHHFD
jgi:pyridoxine kinase